MPFLPSLRAAKVSSSGGVIACRRQRLRCTCAWRIW
jgi:hypothetical protein